MNATIGTRELRADLATHVRRAAAGQRVVVTVGGRPAAVLGPVEPGPETTIDALVTAGSPLGPRRTDPMRPANPVPVWSGIRLDQALREVRG